MPTQFMSARTSMIAKAVLAILTTAAFLTLSTMSASVAYAQSQEEMKRMLNRADQDRDGSISWDEIIALRKSMFVRLDRNKDGFVDRSDRPPFFGSRFDKALEQMSQFDADGDARVSRQELLDGRAPAFERADTNKDKILSAEEIEAMRAAQ